jgi:hypothetical protein
MPFFEIRSMPDGLILYSGEHKNFRACVEMAVKERISLRRADLRQANLLNAMLDGADLREADFSGTNLTGVNLSEAQLDHGLFSGSILVNAVLCESSARNTNFIDASFGATLIAESILDGSYFSTLSAFDLDFQTAGSMKNCSFVNPCHTVCPMTRPPLVIRGLAKPLIIMDRHMKVGNEVFDMKALSEASHGSALLPGSLRLRLEQIVAGERGLSRFGT